MKWFALGLLVFLIVAAGGAGTWVAIRPLPTNTDIAGSHIVSTRACDYRAPTGLDLMCYWVRVGRPGAMATLSVAVFSNAAADGEAPLVYLAGGPGQGNNTAPVMLSVWAQWYQRMNLQQDFVLIDLRGLTPSEPTWDCHGYLQASKKLWQLNLSFAEEAMQSKPLLESCYKQFAEFIHQSTPASGVDQFSSRQNADDVKQVLAALGYRRWDLLGVSYGTRVALVAALTQPEVRRIVLDSPYPLTYGQLSDTPELWAQAFERFFAACDRGLWACPADAGSEALFWTVFESLNSQPFEVFVEDWSTGREQGWLLNGARLAAMIYSAFYSSELYPLVYPTLKSLQEGRAPPSDFLMEYFYNQAFDPEFNNMIFWATECNDNTAESEAEYVAALSGLGRWASLFANDWDVDICRHSAFRPGQKPTMTELDIPVLIAVGEWDPITPLMHGEALLEWLPSALYFPLLDHAHAEFFSGDCAAVILPWFLSTDASALQAQWAEQMRRCQ